MGQGTQVGGVGKYYPKTIFFSSVAVGSQMQMVNADCILHAALEEDKDQVTLE